MLALATKDPWILFNFHSRTGTKNGSGSPPASRKEESRALCASSEAGGEIAFAGDDGNEESPQKLPDYRWSRGGY